MFEGGLCQQLHELTMLSYASCANPNHESFMADNCINCMNDDMHNDHISVMFFSVSVSHSGVSPWE